MAGLRHRGRAHSRQHHGGSPSCAIGAAGGTVSGPARGTIPEAIDWYAIQLLEVAEVRSGEARTAGEAS